MEPTMILRRTETQSVWGPQEEDSFTINSSPDRRTGEHIIISGNETMATQLNFSKCNQFQPKNIAPKHTTNNCITTYDVHDPNDEDSAGTLMSPFDPMSMMTDVNESNVWLSQTSRNYSQYSVFGSNSMIGNLQQQAVMEAEQRAQKIKMNNARYGTMRRILNKEAGIRKYRYQFHDGPDYKRNKDQLKLYQKQLQNIEHELTVMQQKRIIDHDILQQLYEARRDTQIHIDTLAREKQFLAKERALHIQASYAVLQEAESAFQSRPLLANRYVLFNLLGRGGFCEVWRVYDLKDHVYYAAKIHRNFNQANEEHRIQSQLNHCNIVRVFGDLIRGEGVFQGYYVIIMELVESSLSTLLKTNVRLPEIEAQNIVSQIMEALRYLNENSNIAHRVVHYDLKPENVLMTDSGRVKIADFGLSKFSQQNVQMPGISGTYFYLPPECFMTNRPLTISSKIDVWAVGVIFYQLLFGIRPFGQGMTQQQILRKKTILSATTVRYPQGITVSDGSRIFIEQCLTFNVEDRLSVRQHFGLFEQLQY